TAADDKDGFELIVSKVAGDKVNSTVISNIYEEIDNIVQENEENEDEAESPTLDYRDVGNVLRTSGIENVEESKVKDAFNSVIENEKHEFKASSLLPKTVKINTETMKLSLSPKELKNVTSVALNFQSKVKRFIFCQNYE